MSPGHGLQVSLGSWPRAASQGSKSSSSGPQEDGGHRGSVPREPTVRRAPGAPRCVLGSAIRNRGLVELPQPGLAIPQGTGLLPHSG